MLYAFLAGRALFGGFFFLAGIEHFRHVAMMAPYAASKGVPAPRLGVLGSGALIFGGGLSVLLGYHPTWGLLAIALFLIPTTFIMHNYWKATEPMAKMLDQTNFQKNIALLGATLMLLSVSQPWPLSVGW